MVVGASALGPAEEAIGFGDREVVDAGVAGLHEAVGVKFPIFVAVRTEPGTGLIVPFVGEADGDAIAGEGPEFFDEAVFALAGPLLGEEGDDLVVAGEEGGAIAPATVGRVGEGDFVGVAGVPAVFGFADLLDGGFEGEGWEGWAWFVLGHEVSHRQG